MMRSHHVSGFVALIAIILIGAIAILVGQGMLVRAISETKNQSTQDISIRAHLHALSCADTALLKLKNSQTYAGNETISIGNETCFISAIAGSGNMNRSFVATSTVQGISRAISISIQQVNPTTTISSWLEVP